LEDLIAALAAHQIAVLADIRSFPGSRRLPHFNRENLQVELPRAGIAYQWMKDLGGRRKKELEQSPNPGLRNPSFRNYADYMLTDSFRAAAAELLRVAADKRVAIMCAERVYFHCHRMLVSDYLVAHGHEVLHIDAGGPARPHKLTPEARREGEGVVYRGDILPGLEQ
jgi:uncharacterized protein (DUF488 family)